MAVKHHLCGKRVFKTLQRATIRSDELTAESGKVFRGYQCHKCGLYHLTTKSNRQINENLDKWEQRNLGQIKSLFKHNNGKSKNG
jgi:hypothetical protein